MNQELFQIVRYAKGHYGKSDNIMRDLRQVIIKWVGVEHIQDRDILYWVHSAWTKFARKFDKDRFFDQLFYNHPLSWIMDDNNMLKQRENDYGVEDIISLMLNNLRWIEFSDIGLTSWDALPEKYDLNFDLIDNGVHPVGHT